MNIYSSAQVQHSLNQRPLNFEDSSFDRVQVQPSEPDQNLGLLIEHEVSSAIAQDNFVQTTPQQPASTPSGWQWKVFCSTFVTIFLAELGDKTQVSTLLMSAEFHAPWIVFAGAASALITTSLLGVLVGRWLSARLTPRTLDTAAGITLAIISVWLLWDVVKM